MQRFDLAAIAPVPWKNGGGVTRELACWPPGAGMDGFEWRASVACIEQSGPFSAFPGVDRQILLLQGGGVLLRGHGLEHRLDRPHQPFAFSGDEPLQCQLLGDGPDPSSDFNLMLRRGAWRGAVSVTGQPLHAGPYPAGLCLALQGAWRTPAGEMLGPRQGLWWCGPENVLQLSPLPGGQEPAALAWVGLQRG
ncbi:MAG TPA: histidine utilization protein HutD [Comamonadaceae bacterium]|uniref:HutD/Ves family protein n=1 Tax=Pulveribacter sp. TaxID=2678893 RepID=UPI000EE651AB|nr:HutD family protein [Pulveribacter sp.]HCL84973.1 histidine utilization protein HutD [Comamonadaceae bacterium]